MVAFQKWPCSHNCRISRIVWDGSEVGLVAAVPGPTGCFMRGVLFNTGPSTAHCERAGSVGRLCSTVGIRVACTVDIRKDVGIIRGCTSRGSDSGLAGVSRGSGSAFLVYACGKCT